MVNYDGPSYFRKNHPKVKSIKDDRTRETEQKASYELPNNVRTRKSMHEEARHYMQTPSQATTNDPPPERFPFKRTHTPTSLQKLDGWANQQKANPLYIEIEQRLKKEDTTYLLFEEHLSDEMKQKLEKKKPEPRHTPIVAEDHVTLVREGLKTDFLKKNTGLHRSLSKIMDDEQKTIRKNQKSLNKLFDQDKKRK